MIGQTEILIISGVVILLFGASALPKLARSLGKAKKEFQKGLDGEPDGEPDWEPDGEPDGKPDKTANDDEPGTDAEGK